VVCGVCGVVCVVCVRVVCVVCVCVWYMCVWCVCVWCVCGVCWGCVCVWCVCMYIYIYIYIHISDCVQTVYELPLLPNNTAGKRFYASREQCELLTGYLLLERRSGGDWANT